VEWDNAVSDYPTCAACFASLYIEAGDIDPEYITECLKTGPTSTQKKGELARISSSRVNPHSGWRLSSKAAVDSKDLRSHLDWLFDRIARRRAELEALRAMGCVIHVACYWLSKAGHGGPMISLPQIRKLVELELELWMDIYFLGEPEFEDGGPEGPEEMHFEKDQGKETRT
jgi:Domain of unknown function (DUF4279)